MQRTLLIACMCLAACWRGAAPVEHPAPEPSPVRVATARARASTPAPPGEVEAALLVEDGDKAFVRADLAAAEALYKQALAYPRARVVDYARYKLAWVYFDTSKPRAALDLFVLVAHHASDPILAETAGDDAARVYAVSTAAWQAQMARDFLERLGPERVDHRLGLLADAYDIAGKTAEAALVRAQLTP